MASNPTASAPTPDTPITLKVNIEGSNRRFKLPLRDLVPSVLPDKLRYLLAIPPTSEVLIERYSDSAASFVVLDVNNSGVYKQLYRAAKAKLKLRLKVVVKVKEPVMPKPATVEDEEQASTEHVESPKVVSSVSLSNTEKMMAMRSLSAMNGMIQQEQPKVKEPGSARSMLVVRQRPENPLEFLPPFILPESSRSCKESKGDDLVSRFISSKAAGKALPPAPSAAPVESMFSVYCNNCSASIPDTHYHCSICDEGDFDLCPACNAAGVTCNGDHWLIKRTVEKGKYVHSTTETFAPKKHFSDSKATLVAPVIEEKKVPEATRTCNCCIVEMTELHFVTCLDCEDFDLCMKCHVRMKHGHNPKHAFAFVDEDFNHGALSRALLRPGRNTCHTAVCDGCDEYIYGVRHKCLDCPDWDYCGSCIPNARIIHPDHRFIPLYEPLATGVRQQSMKVRHHGIFCDGPLCNSGDDSSMSSYITGDRFKCCVCHDTDFCAGCEASPLNTHNKTHPLVKFKTPVRNVSVTTLGDHPNGKAMPPMGDRRPESQTDSKTTETVPAQSANAATQVQTVAEVKPTEAKIEQVAKVEEPVEKVVKIEEPVKGKEVAEELSAAVEEELIAHFVRDAVADGTIMTPNSVFEQTWYLRNGGKSVWPAGCSVRFVGGDNMCAVDPDHPASVHELVSAAESTICYTEVAPGQEYGFTVLMRTPNRAGDFISYWRLTTPSGEKFGHRLWCDISVKEPAPVAMEEVKAAQISFLKEAQQAASSISILKLDVAALHKAQAKAAANAAADTKVEANTDAVFTKAEGSQMIFPKLVKESPSSSVHEEAQHKEVQQASEVPATEEIFDDDFEEFNESQEYDGSEDGFMTDEEYDILDADDEEYLAEQEAASKK